ncbi:MAG: IclR family transcriptional regulator [Gammaproteobacteria bacterium]|nr:IclR family transcriptional regulator [Gammaproteobacteria bacterium]
MAKTPSPSPSPAGSGSSSGSIQVIDRLTVLLEGIARHRDPVSLKVLAADAGLHPSTAFRILAAAIENGLVAREGSHYRLGIRLLQWGSRVASHRDLRREARPLMEALRDKIGETVNLTVRQGDEVVYLDRALPERMMRVEQRIGSRAPLHVTAVGKLMLGEGSETDCREYARRTGLPGYTRYSFTDEEQLVQHVSGCVRAGFAYDDEEAETGVGCIGVLVHDDAGQIVAGLSISAPIERRRDEWIELLKDTARALSAGSVTR